MTINPNTLNDIDENNEWLTRRMDEDYNDDEDLVFDDDDFLHGARLQGLLKQRKVTIMLELGHL